MPDRGIVVSIEQDAPVPLDVRFECGPNDTLAIFGPSGSGKSTILRTIAGLHRPRQAHVACGGETWTDTQAAIFTPPHRRAVGFVFQEYALFPHLTARANVAAALGGQPRQARRARAEALLARVQLSPHADRRPHELSGGERQRVALARALAREPRVLLLDEPFAAVDRVLRRRLQDELDEVRQTLSAPLVLVTHDFDDVVRLATHVLLLDHGRTVAAGPLATLTSRADLPWLRDAVGLGAVFDAAVVGLEVGRGLARIEFGGGTLLAAVPGAAPGTPVRVRIPAREVILATRAPEGLSLHNVIEGIVTALHVDDALPYVMVQVAVGDVRLLAEITRDALDRLQLSIGRPVHALVKSVSIDVRASHGVRSTSV